MVLRRVGIYRAYDHCLGENMQSSYIIQSGDKDDDADGQKKGQETENIESPCSAHIVTSCLSTVDLSMPRVRGDIKWTKQPCRDDMLVFVR